MILGVVGFAMILVLMALPRGRETARLAGCQKNMMQIGFGLQMYHNARGKYPTIPALGDPPGDGPIKSMLDAFVLPDLMEIKDPAKPPTSSLAPTKGSRVRGLTCQSDPNVLEAGSAPVISYRANAGNDPAGGGGPFQPGRVVTREEIEASDGESFTAAFAERLIGDGKDGRSGLENYAISTDPVSAVGPVDFPADRWRGDAGSDWSEASWRSTLYNHLIAPNGGPSCIAKDGKTARTGASSGHVNRVNVLMMDGSLRGVTLTIDPKVWQALGTVGPPPTDEAK